MEDQTGEVELFANIKRPSEEEVGDEAQRRGVGAHELMEEALERLAEERGGTDEERVEVEGGELVGGLALGGKWWAVGEGKQEKVDVEMSLLLLLL